MKENILLSEEKVSYEIEIGTENDVTESHGHTGTQSEDFQAQMIGQLKQECTEKDATIEDYKKQMEEMRESLILAQE